MGHVNDWVGTIGGTILVLELIVLLVILVAINAVLALGLRWVLRKSTVAHEKIAWARALVLRYVDRGVGLAAAPVIMSTSVWRGLKAGLYRATHWPAAPATTVAPQRATAGSTSAGAAAGMDGPTRAA